MIAIVTSEYQGIKAFREVDTNHYIGAYESR